MVNRDCRECVFFIGKLDKNPRWMWSHCRSGVNNITIDFASECTRYADSYQMALDLKMKEYKEKYKWMIPKITCPCCGAVKEG